MSTKITLGYGKDFHLYQDMIDEKDIYLEIKQDKVWHTIKIPGYIWEFIRTIPSMDLSIADKTDEEILSDVIKEVDTRISDYQSAIKRKDDFGAAIVAVLGGYYYGDVNLPRDQQLKNGLEYFLQKREEQRQTKQEIEQLQRENQ